MKRELEPLGVGGGAVCGGRRVGQQAVKGVETGISAVEQRVLVLASAEHFLGDIERG